MISIHYNNGQVLQGVVLAFGDRVVRVAVQDSDDALEFRLINRVWVSEDCEVVQMKFADESSAVENGEADLLDTSFRFQQQPLSLQRVM